MSIFGNIVSAIFGHSSAHTTTSATGSSPSASPSASSSAPPIAPTAGGPAAAKPMTRAEVEAMIKKLADAQREKYNWRESIVDLMKLLKLDSSLGARKQLAQELGYKGALDGSAEMNIWLHQQVMTRLAETGGKAPEDLKHA